MYRNIDTYLDTYYLLYLDGLSSQFFVYQVCAIINTSLGCRQFYFCVLGVYSIRSLIKAVNKEKPTGTTDVFPGKIVFSIYVSLLSLLYKYIKSRLLFADRLTD